MLKSSKEINCFFSYPTASYIHEHDSMDDSFLLIKCSKKSILGGYKKIGTVDKRSSRHLGIVGCIANAEPDKVVGFIFYKVDALGNNEYFITKKEKNISNNLCQLYKKLHTMNTGKQTIKSNDEINVKDLGMVIIKIFDNEKIKDESTLFQSTPIKLPAAITNINTVIDNRKKTNLSSNDPRSQGYELVGYLNRGPTFSSRYDLFHKKDNLGNNHYSVVDTIWGDSQSFTFVTLRSLNTGKQEIKSNDKIFINNNSTTVVMVDTKQTNKKKTEDPLNINDFKLIGHLSRGPLFSALPGHLYEKETTQGNRFFYYAIDIKRNGNTWKHGSQHNLPFQGRDNKLIYKIIDVIDYGFKPIKVGDKINVKGLGEVELTEPFPIQFF